VASFFLLTPNEKTCLSAGRMEVGWDTCFHLPFSLFVKKRASLEPIISLPIEWQSSMGADRRSTSHLLISNEMIQRRSYVLNYLIDMGDSTRIRLSRIRKRIIEIGTKKAKNARLSTMERSTEFDL
jgi:hypothetical protein